MVNKIYDLTSILKEVRLDFQAAFVNAEETRKKNWRL